MALLALLPNHSTDTGHLINHLRLFTTTIKTVSFTIITATAGGPSMALPRIVMADRGQSVAFGSVHEGEEDKIIE